MSGSAAYFKRCIQVFALALALAALALIPIAIEKNWVLWPAVTILIVDLAVVFATIDYMAGQWLDGEEVRPSSRFRSGRVHGI